MQPTIASEPQAGRPVLSAISGLSLRLAGFHAIDERFRTAPFDRNLPVLLGLLTVWYADFPHLDRRRTRLRSVCAEGTPDWLVPHRVIEG
jgi:hypothetical protein